MEAVGLSGQLPGGDGDGLHVITGELIHNPRKLHAVIAIIDCAKITTKPDDGSIVPTARVRRIEVLISEDLPVAEKLIRRALDSRSAGGADGVLPFELEQDLEEAFRRLEAQAADGDDDGEDDPGTE